MPGMKTQNTRLDEMYSPTEKMETFFYKNNTHFLYGEIDEESIKKTIQWITYENMNESEEKVLTLYINSSGGDLYEAFALIDTMKASKYEVRTIGLGKIMSAAFLIFCSGTKGQRFIGKNTGIMCHQHHDNIDGKYHDLRASMKEGEHCNERMLDILKECSFLDTKTIRSKLMNSSDVYLKSDELVTYGLADQIF